GRSKSSAPNAATLARYCGLAQQFQADGVSNGVFSATGNVAGSSTAIGRVFQDMGPTIAEMEADAPSKIRGNVRTVVAALQKAQAGDRRGLSTSAFAAATGRLRA